MRRAGGTRHVYQEKVEVAEQKQLLVEPAKVAEPKPLPVVQELVSDHSEKAGELLVSEPPAVVKEDKKKDKKKKHQLILEDEGEAHE